MPEHKAIKPDAGLSRQMLPSQENSGKIMRKIGNCFKRIAATFRLTDAQAKLLSELKRPCC
jgi:Mg2+ and Co2+ transporter CorA